MKYEAYDALHELDKDQLKSVIKHLNIALARCYAVLAELECPAEHVQARIDPELLN